MAGRSQSDTSHSKTCRPCTGRDRPLPCGMILAADRITHIGGPAPANSAARAQPCRLRDHPPHTRQVACWPLRVRTKEAQLESRRELDLEPPQPLVERPQPSRLATVTSWPCAQAPFRATVTEPRAGTHTSRPFGGAVLVAHAVPPTATAPTATPTAPARAAFRYFFISAPKGRGVATARLVPACDGLQLASSHDGSLAVCG